MQVETLLQVQRELALAFAEASALQETSSRVLDAALRIEGVDCGAVYLVRARTRAVEVIAHAGAPTKQSEDDLARMAGNAAEASAVEFTHGGGQGLRAAASVPVVYHGRTMGVLCLASRTLDEFPAESRNIIEWAGRLATHAVVRLRDMLALRESEEKYRKVVEYAKEAIGIAQDGMLKVVNARMCELLGHPAEHIMARPFAEFIHPDDRELVGRSHRDRLAGMHPVEDYDFRVVTRDGDVRRVEIHASLVQWAGRPASLNLINDVTIARQAAAERARLEEQLRQAQKMEAVGRLAGGVAHDFNNLLTGINGYAELLLARMTSAHPMYSHLTEIRKAAQRAASLTSQLLAFSRKQPYSPRIVDLDEIIASQTNLLKRLIGEHILLSFQTHAGRSTIKADPGQIEQVLINLVVNARDAMPAGGEITITTSKASLTPESCKEREGAEPGDYVLLSVSDNGCGMSPEVRERAFEPFFTTKEVGKGTGLGLSTVYGIVQQNRGFVSLESAPGRGSTFRIYLPIAPGSAQPAVVADSPAPGAGHETVLLVEDDDSVRQLTVHILREQGYAVIAASGALEAVELCGGYKGDISLLLSDVVMPGMNGKALYERLRELRPNLKALFMSGYTQEVIGQHGVLEQGFPFIQKPFTVGALTARIRAAIEG